MNRLLVCVLAFSAYCYTQAPGPQTAAVKITALGANDTSVQDDKAHMNGALRVIPAQLYVKHEIQIPTGQVVREFVSAEGTVFGVAWKRPSQPDLKQLLGSYFEPVKQAVAVQHRHGHGPIFVETPLFVFQQGGHVRSFHGRAYVPSMVPQGVDVTEIQ